MIDLIALLEDGLRAKPPRGDEHLPHCSDNICDLQTWARRSGEPMLPHEFKTLVKFELGHQFEASIAGTLRRELQDDYAIRQDVECEINGVKGHADFVAVCVNDPGHYGDGTNEFLLEIKSTSFLRGKVPTEPASWYVEQAALYAAALDVARFGILVGCRESGKIAPIFWFNLDDDVPNPVAGDPQTWREWANSRAEQIVEQTDPEGMPPPAEPRTGWACRTCRWAKCEKNLNPARLA